jgi:hypothetical protein
MVGLSVLGLLVLWRPALGPALPDECTLAGGECPRLYVAGSGSDAVKVSKVERTDDYNVALCRDAKCDGASDQTTAPRFAGDLRLAHSEFLALHSIAYRTRMFRLLSEIHTLDNAEIYTRFEQILAEAGRGGDGIEPLLLAYADALAYRRDDKRVPLAVTALAKAAKTIKFAYARPFAGMLVPIGRVQTRLVIDVRADAARALVLDLMKNPSYMLLDDLLGLAVVQEDICSLAPAKGSIDVLDELKRVDEKRQKACLGGGGKPGGGAPGATAAITATSCLDMSLDDFRMDDEYTTDERTADLEQCLEDTMGTGNGNSLANGATTFIGWLLGKDPKSQPLWEAAKGVGGLAGDLSKTFLNAYIAERTVDRANAREDEKAFIDAMIKVAKAVAALDAAERNLDDAQRRYDAAENNYQDRVTERNNATTALGAPGAMGGVPTDEEQRYREQRVADAQSDLNKAEERRNKAEQDLKDANTAKNKALAEAGAAKGEAAQFEANKKRQSPQDSPFEPDFHSPACNRLATGGKDINNPVDIRRLPKDWAEVTSRLPRVSNPNPLADPPSPSDSFGLSACGDDLTTRTRAAKNCSALVLCTDEMEQCGCSISAQEAEARAQFLLDAQSALACISAICADGSTGVAHGLVCSCESGAQSTDVPPRPLPIHSGLIEVMFMSSGAAAAIDGTQDPVSSLARDIVRR